MDPKAYVSDDQEAAWEAHLARIERQATQARPPAAVPDEQWEDVE